VWRAIERRSFATGAQSAAVSALHESRSSVPG
jgi:hypothetical protein